MKIEVTLLVAGTSSSARTCCDRMVAEGSAMPKALLAKLESAIWMCLLPSLSSMRLSSGTIASMCRRWSAGVDDTSTTSKSLTRDLNPDHSELYTLERLIAERTHR